MPNNYKICNRCVMDNTSDHTISFYNDGTCSYCTDTLHRMKTEYFPNKIGLQFLEQTAEQIKQESKKLDFDCIVGISGGVDSSYVLLLGAQLKLRMLAVHIDDEFDTPIALKNIKKICDVTQTELVNIKPPMEEYKALTLALFKAAVPNLALVQDNLIFKALQETAQKHKIKFSLSGANFATENILQRSTEANAFDKKHILSLYKLFGEKRQHLNKISLMSMWDKYIRSKYLSPVKTFYPLNYVNYNLDAVLHELKEVADYQYYGGKHYESILTRFLQCWYLPVKYDIDKRRSHFSSLIVSGQMLRDRALLLLEQPLYPDQTIFNSDIEYLASYFNLATNDFNDLIHATPRKHSDYPRSNLHYLAPIARRFRKFLG